MREEKALSGRHVQYPIENTVRVQVTEVVADFCVGNPIDRLQVILPYQQFVREHLEALQQDPPLMGGDAKEQALVEMWHRRVEIHGLMAIADALRNTAERFQNHAVPSAVPYAQIPELAERGMGRIPDYFKMLDERLSESAYLAGETYSVADILALVCVDFAGVVHMKPSDDLAALKSWYDNVSSRPSAAA